MTEAVPLPGGRMTDGVVRIGATVRRPAAAAFVVDLLRLLHERGFAGAPEHLGRDELGRDILTYLPGWVPPKFRVWSDAQIRAAAILLRGFHDASRGSALTAGHPVVCHHDPGPNNAVFQDGRPVAFIDFDLAAPGSPLEDLGYLAWTWCIASKAGPGAVEKQAAQVRIAADAYGAGDTERRALVDAILEQQARNARFWAERSGSTPEVPDRIEWSRRQLQFVADHRREFELRLTGRIPPAGP